MVEDFMVVVNKKRTLMGFIIISILLIVFMLIQRYQPQEAKKVMGGILQTQNFNEEDVKEIRKSEDVETYFRPSDLPVLNDRFISSSTQFYTDYNRKEVSEIILPKELMQSPEETIINYFIAMQPIGSMVRMQAAVQSV